MWFDNQAEPSKFQGFGFQNEQNVTDTRKWLYAPNFRDMQPSMPMFAVVSHRKVVTEPVAMLSIVFYYPTNTRFNSRISLVVQLYRHILKSSLIVTDNSKTSNSRARVALGAAKTTATMPYYGRIVLHYMWNYVFVLFGGSHLMEKLTFTNHTSP